MIDFGSMLESMLLPHHSSKDLALQSLKSPLWTFLWRSLVIRVTLFWSCLCVISLWSLVSLLPIPETHPCEHTVAHVPDHICDTCLSPIPVTYPCDICLCPIGAVFLLNSCVFCEFIRTSPMIHTILHCPGVSLGTTSMVDYLWLLIYRVNAFRWVDLSPMNL
jgi:hypothetical protein